MCGRLKLSTSSPCHDEQKIIKMLLFSHTKSFVDDELFGWIQMTLWFFPSPLSLASLLSIIAYTHRYYCWWTSSRRQTENDYGVLSMLTSLLDRTVTVLLVNWELKLTCVALRGDFALGNNSEFSERPYTLNSVSLWCGNQLKYSSHSPCCYFNLLLRGHVLHQSILNRNSNI